MLFRDTAFKLHIVQFVSLIKYMVIFFKTYLLRKSAGDFEETQGFALKINGRMGNNPINFFWKKAFLGALTGCRKVRVYYGC